jgi:hypothetical protein
MPMPPAPRLMASTAPTAAHLLRDPFVFMCPSKGSCSVMYRPSSSRDRNCCAPNSSSRWAFAGSATFAVRNRRFVELDSPLDSPLG